jgi:hypothetical protein
MSIAITLPDLVPAELADELRLEFPRFPSPTFGEEKVRDQGRAFRRLAERLASPEFLQQAAKLVGVDELQMDPDFMGAGLRGAREASLPGWWHGRGRRGWWARAGLVVNLTPDWRDPFTAGAGAALLTKTPLPEIVELQPPTAADGPCLALLATLYTRHPPHVDELPELPEPEPETPLELPETFGRDPSLFEADLALLRAIAAARGASLRRAVERETALAERAMTLVERPFWDGTGPFGDEEILTVRRIADGRATLLARFAEVEERYREASREILALPHPPLDGPALFERIDGYWRDRWVTARLEMVLRPARALTRLRLRGFVPPEVASRLRFVAQVGSAQHRLTAAAGELTWEMPLEAAAGQSLPIIVQASHQWIPAHDGESPDPRALSWLLTGVDVS